MSPARCDASVLSSLYTILASTQGEGEIMAIEGDASVPSSLHTTPAPTREARGDKGITQCASRYAFTTAPMPASEFGELHTQGYLVLSSRVGVKLVLSRIICPMSNCQAVQLIPFCCM